MAPTLRTRLTAWNLLIVATALTLFAILLYGWLARTLYRHHDADLAADADTIIEALQDAVDPARALAGLDAADTGGPLLLLRDSTGQTLFRSSALATGERSIAADLPATHAERGGVTPPRYFTTKLANEPVRFVCERLSTGKYLHVGRRLGEVEDLLRVLAVASAVLVPLVVFLTSFSSLVTARRALSPIDLMASTLESIQATDLSRRVKANPRDAEIARLSMAVNRLLDRLQASFSAMKDFTAEVSHQLQTPLAVMKGTVEAAQRQTGPAHHQQVLADMSADIDALTATVRDLRDYAVAEAESVPAGSAPIDASAVFEEAAELIRALAEPHHITCDAKIAEGIRVWGSAVRLRQVLLNLGENAVQFTPTGGHIAISAFTAHDRAVLKVADTGSGIAADALPRVFDRHFHARRSDGSRGSGLGLAIVKRIVEAHGGTIAIESSLTAGTWVEVTLPAAHPGQAASRG